MMVSVWRYSQEMSEIKETHLFPQHASIYFYA